MLLFTATAKRKGKVSASAFQQHLDRGYTFVGLRKGNTDSKNFNKNTQRVVNNAVDFIKSTLTTGQIHNDIDIAVLEAAWEDHLVKLTRAFGESYYGDATPLFHFTYHGSPTGSDLKDVIPKSPDISESAPWICTRCHIGFVSREALY